MNAIEVTGLVRRYGDFTAVALVVLAVGASVGFGGSALTLSASAGASTASDQAFCAAVAQLPNSPSVVASHWPTLTASPTHILDLAVANEVDVLESALSLAALTAPVTLHATYYTASAAATAEQFAVRLLDPSFNSSKTTSAVAGYLFIVHHQAAIGSTALSRAATATRRQCRTYVGTSAARQFALSAANYARSLSASGAPTRDEIQTGAVKSGHAVTVLVVTPTRGTVTRVKYGVAVIYRTDTVCVAFSGAQVPRIATC